MDKIAINKILPNSSILKKTIKNNETKKMLPKQFDKRSETDD